MFESLRYGWKPKDVRNAIIGVAAFAVIVLVAAFRPDDGVGLGVPLEAVVVSSGPVDVTRVCGGTREIAVVRLASGQVVQASVSPSSPLQPAHGWLSASNSTTATRLVTRLLFAGKLRPNCSSKRTRVPRAA